METDDGVRVTSDPDGYFATATAHRGLPLSGEYAALHHNASSYVVSLDDSATATLDVNNGREFRVRFERSGSTLSGEWGKDGDPPTFGEIPGNMLATSIILHLMPKLTKQTLPGMEINVSGTGRNALPSAEEHAEEAVAVIAAMLTTLGTDYWMPVTTHKLAQLVHTMRSGKRWDPGLEVAASVLGSASYRPFSAKLMKSAVADLNSGNFARFLADRWDEQHTKIPFPKDMGFMIARLVGDDLPARYDIGAVLKGFKDQEERYMGLIRTIELGSETVSLTMTVASKREPTDDELEELKLSAESARSAKREIGRIAGMDLEPRQYSEIIDETYARGAILCELVRDGSDRHYVVAAHQNAQSAERIEALWSSSRSLSIERASVSNEGLALTRNQRLRNRR